MLSEVKCVLSLQRSTYWSLHVEWCIRTTWVHKNKYQTSLTSVDMGTFGYTHPQGKAHSLNYHGTCVWLKKNCVSLLICVVSRCLTGPSTTVSVEGQTEKAGSMQPIFQREFHLPFLKRTCCCCWFCQQKPWPSCISVIYNCSFLFPISVHRSYHGYKTIKDFVRRRRWARYYKKKHWHISFQYICSTLHLTFVLCVHVGKYILWLIIGQ